MSNYYGENPCQAIYLSGKKKNTNCQNNAYYLDNNKLLCGTHSHKVSRSNFPKNKNVLINKINLYNERQKLIDSMALQNQQLNKKGNVICSKFKMMKQPDHFDGYFKIFPNFKHDNRQDGYGCSELSPKSLGPIIHTMSNLPIAKNLENYHQGSKIFFGEVDDNNQIKKESINIRKKIYECAIPYRHKFEHPDAKRIITNIGENKNIPLFSVYYDKHGKEYRYNYIECRYFYCHYYEILTPQTESYKKLKDLLNNGYNLQIIGYDGFEIDTTKDLMEYYLDDTRPFGHELVLYSLLTLNDKNEYPWNRYYTTHQAIYREVI